MINRDEYRVVTTFEPFKSWDYGAQRYRWIDDHQHVSMTFSTLEGAERTADWMVGLHPFRDPYDPVQGGGR